MQQSYKDKPDASEYSPKSWRHTLSRVQKDSKRDSRVETEAIGKWRYLPDEGPANVVAPNDMINRMSNTQHCTEQNKAKELLLFLHSKISKIWDVTKGVQSIKATK